MYGNGRAAGGVTCGGSGSHTHGRQLKFTFAARPRSSMKVAAGGETKLGEPGSPMPMAVLEGLVPSRRPHHAVELAVVVMPRRPSSSALPRLGGLEGIKSYVNTIRVLRVLPENHTPYAVVSTRCLLRCRSAAFATSRRYHTFRFDVDHHMTPCPRATRFKPESGPL